MLKLQEIKSKELKNTKLSDPPEGNTSPLFLFSLKSLFEVGPSTEKSIKKALATELSDLVCKTLYGVVRNSSSIPASNVLLSYVF